MAAGGRSVPPRRCTTIMKASQPRLRAPCAIRVTRSFSPIPATANAQSAVIASAAASGLRGKLPSPSLRSAQSASDANSSAASAWLPRISVGTIRSPRAVGEDHDADRLEQDQQVEKGRVVLRVIKVIFQLVPAVVDRRAI